MFISRQTESLSLDNPHQKSKMKIFHSNNFQKKCREAKHEYIFWELPERNHFFSGLARLSLALIVTFFDVSPKAEKDKENHNKLLKKKFHR